MDTLAFLVPVWGKDYVSLMLNCLLPSLLTANNLPTLSQHKRSVLVISTTIEGKELAQDSKVIQRCQEFLDIRFTLGDQYVDENKYSSMTRLYMLGLSSLNSGNNINVVYLTPDMFCSDGTVISLLRYLRQGKKMIMVLGPRVVKDTFLKSIQPYLSDHSDCNDLGNTNFLTKLILAHLHPLSKTMNVLGNDFNYDWPSALFWIEENIIIAHGFHLHPFLICQDKDSIRDCSKSFSKHKHPPTIDHKEYLSLAVKQYNSDSIIVANPSDMIVVGLTEVKDELIGKRFNRSVFSSTNASIFRILYWSLLNTSDFQWDLFRYKVIYGSVNDAYSQALVDKSNILVNKILKLKGNYLVMFCISSRMLLAKIKFLVSRAVQMPGRVLRKIRF